MLAVCSGSLLFTIISYNLKSNLTHLKSCDRHGSMGIFRILGEMGGSLVTHQIGEWSFPEYLVPRVDHPESWNVVLFY